jgi:hypothetical protein
MFPQTGSEGIFAFKGFEIDEEMEFAKAPKQSLGAFQWNQVLSLACQAI